MPIEKRVFGLGHYLRPSMIHLVECSNVLLQGYQAVVVQYCTTLLDDAADGEDVAQEVFLAILRALPRYEPTALLRTWVFRIARNRCLKHRATRWAWGRLSGRKPASSPPSTS